MCLAPIDWYIGVIRKFIQIRIIINLIKDALVKQTKNAEKKTDAIMSKYLIISRDSCLSFRYMITVLHMTVSMPRQFAAVEAIIQCIMNQLNSYKKVKSICNNDKTWIHLCLNWWVTNIHFLILYTCLSLSI